MRYITSLIFDEICHQKDRKTITERIVYSFSMSYFPRTKDKYNCTHSRRTSVRLSIMWPTICHMIAWHQYRQWPDESPEGRTETLSRFKLRVLEVIFTSTIVHLPLKTHFCFLSFSLLIPHLALVFSYIKKG